MKRAIAAAFLVVIASTATVVLAEQVVVARATDLRSARFIDAPVLRRIDAGTRVDLVGTEAGWVNVRLPDTSGWMRASGLAGDGAAVAALARVESGRSAANNIVVAAGIRRIPKASRVALIMGVDRVASMAWPGVAHDVGSARRIARALGVPDDNVDALSGDAATRSGIEEAVNRLASRVQPGDQVFVFFSGPGMRVASEAQRATCEAAWVASDGTPLTARRLATPMRQLAATAARVIVVADAGFDADSPAGVQRKSVPSDPAARCGDNGSADTLPLAAALVAAGAATGNVVVVQSAGAAQGVDQPGEGGWFTQAFEDCFFGDATDLDGSGSISVDEIARCIQAHRGASGTASLRADVTGNAGIVPLIGAGVEAPGAAAVAPRAAIADVLAQRDARIRVGLTATPTTLAIGRDFVDLQLTSNRDGYVYVVLLGSDEKSFYLLFPNELDADNRIGAGDTLRLPRPQWRVQSQGPPGRDVVLAIVADSPRDLRVLKRREGPFNAMLTDLEGRVALQWLLGHSGEGDSEACATAGQRRNLQLVRACSDAYGAAQVELIER